MSHEDMTKRVTLRDVAEEAGVHPSTASRALNEDTNSVVHPETVARVLEIAEDLGYSPNPLAKGLRTNRSMTIGMVISDIENPLFGPIIAGVEATAGSEGYSTLIVEAVAPDHAGLSPVINALVDRRVDGVILAMALRTGENAAYLKRLNVPIVLVNRTVDGASVPAIVGDDHHGIGLAVSHMAELGHTRIGHLAGPQETSTGLNRLRGFKSHMEELGLKHGADVIAEAESFQVEPGYKAASTLLDTRPDLTGLVAANDLIALGAYAAIRDRGHEVGRDISITGYNDMMLLDMMQPSLTSIRVPYREMGSEAAAVLLELMSTANAGSGQTAKKLRPTLSARESTQPAKAAN